mmetsp:Transcript_62818/g.164732  ORF Transcript_62818/g.164732 Transcript_62818/m.164732 type:complete len:214 (-) Transcript_62818:2-643(-)
MVPKPTQRPEIWKSRSAAPAPEAPPRLRLKGQQSPHWPWSTTKRPQPNHSLRCRSSLASPAATTSFVSCPCRSGRTGLSRRPRGRRRWLWPRPPPSLLGPRRPRPHRRRPRCPTSSTAPSPVASARRPRPVATGPRSGSRTKGRGLRRRRRRRREKQKCEHSFLGPAHGGPPPRAVGRLLSKEWLLRGRHGDQSAKDSPPVLVSRFLPGSSNA